MDEGGRVLTMTTRLCRIYIIRHAESRANILENKNQSLESLNMGELGTELSEKGYLQASLMANHLGKVSFDAIFSSDLIRAHETAKLLGEKRNLTIRTTAAIRELDYGKHSLNFYKVKDTVKQAISKLEDTDKMKFQFDDIETEEHGANRLITFLQNVAVEYAGKTVAVISHGRVMRVLLIKLGFARYDDLPSGSIDNTGYFILETNGVDFLVKENHGILQKNKIKQ